jgi:2-iminoacetate synthase ThiH
MKRNHHTDNICIKLRFEALQLANKSGGRSTKATVEHEEINPRALVHKSWNNYPLTLN